MSRITTGDVRRMASDDLYAMLERFVNANQHITRPYYILVIVKNSYQGPAAQGKNHEGEVETVEMKLPDKLIHNRIVGPMMEPPLIKQLGSMLWKIDNRLGQASLVYALPQDIPTAMEDSDNAGTVVPKVAESARGIPLIWN